VTTETPQIARGLAGVVADTTTISMVNPATNSLLYRGYPVQELAARCRFEEVAYLLWHGELPTKAELAAFEEAERAARALPDGLLDALERLPAGCHPMDLLRSGVAYLGAHDPAEDDNDPVVNLAKSISLMAKIPSIVAFAQRRRHNQQPIAPDPGRPFAENFLAMSLGSVPDPAVVRAFEISLVLYAEHSFNASTFTARVIASTLSDLYSAVVGAIGALKGPLHGGANEAVMDLFNEIGDADRVEAWLPDALAARRKIMGFGHRVYKNGDSRVPTMHAALVELAGNHPDGPRLLALYDALASAMLAEKGLHPNLDYPSGPAYHLIGFDTPIFTPIFVVSRITGWTAHVMEQLDNNALIRPLSAYVGPEQRSVPASR
jgi:citrate synthase